MHKERSANVDHGFNQPLGIPQIAEKGATIRICFLEKSTIIATLSGRCQINH